MHTFSALTESVFGNTDKTMTNSIIVSVIVREVHVAVTEEWRHHEGSLEVAAEKVNLAKEGWIVWELQCKQHFPFLFHRPSSVWRRGRDGVMWGREWGWAEKGKSHFLIRISPITGPISWIAIVIHAQIIKWYNFLETLLLASLRMVVEHISLWSLSACFCILSSKPELSPGKTVLFLYC